jgi:uncharacterized protein
MDPSSFDSIFSRYKEKMIRVFDENLKPSLHYHNSAHTLDVIAKVEDIARLEGIVNPEQIFILRMAALFHDSGFLYVYKNHEEKSCEIMKEELVSLDLPDHVIDQIVHLIMMTKLPPNPSNHLEQIICDADVDYLGRDDFFEISNRLKAEFLEYGIVKDESEWQEKQIRFFEFQKFFTRTSQGRRMTKKNEIYLKLRKIYEPGIPQ